MQVTKKNKVSPKRKPIFRRVLKYLIFGTNVVALLLLIGSVSAWDVAPSKFIGFSYLGLLFPIILVINIAYLLLWLFTRNWKLVLVSTLVLLYCINPISTYFPYHFGERKSSSSDTLRVMTYNVMAFNWYLRHNGVVNPVFRFVRKVNADVVCMQEYMVDRQSGGSVATNKQVKQLLKNYPYYSVVELPASNSHSIYGLACYSKYPIVKTEKIPYSATTFNGSAIFRIKVKGKTISVINNHLESNKITSQDKQLYHNFLKTKDSEMIEGVINNIKSKLKPAFTQREAQAELLATYIEKERSQTDGIIVCGDFNDTPISYTYNTVKGNLLDAFVQRGKGVGITYHRNKFLFRIDYIFHDKNMRTYRVKVPRVKFSDHYPVVADIELLQ